MTTTRRLVREDWLAIARTSLVQSGIDDVKVDRLAKRLKVTRGSFYWHFRSRKDLHDALLKEWEVRNHLEIAEVRARWDEVGPDLSEIVHIWLGEDPNFPAFDIAIRSWGRRSQLVSRSVTRVDVAWISLIKELFEKSGYHGDESMVRARIVYFHQIGYYAMAVEENLDERIRLAPIYYHALTGKKAGPELDAVFEKLRAAPRWRAPARVHR